MRPASTALQSGPISGPRALFAHEGAIARLTVKRGSGGRSWAGSTDPGARRPPFHNVSVTDRSRPYIGMRCADLPPLADGLRTSGALPRRAPVSPPKNEAIGYRSRERWTSDRAPLQIHGGRGRWG